MGGVETVYLTAREHYICHFLLLKMTEGVDKSKMWHAFSRMNINSKNHQRYTSKLYEFFKKNHSAAGPNHFNRGKPSWNKGLKSPWTSERNRKLKGSKSPNRQKRYLIITPAGEQFEITGLVDFCKNNGLSASNMCSVSKGNLKQYKGYKCFLL